MSDAPTLGPVAHHSGVAGQESYAVTVSYPGEAPARVEFVGSTRYGGPVVMLTRPVDDAASGVQTFVTDPDRFGTFSAEWVRRFFGVAYDQVIGKPVADR